MTLGLGPALARREWQRLLRIRGSLGLGLILPLAPVLVLRRAGVTDADAAGVARGALTVLALLAGAAAGGMARRDVVLGMDAVVDLACCADWESDAFRAACAAVLGGWWASVVVFLSAWARLTAASAGGWRPVLAAAVLAGVWGFAAAAMARRMVQDFPALAAALGAAAVALSDAFHPFWSPPQAFSSLLWLNPVVYGADLLGWAQTGRSVRGLPLDAAAFLILAIAALLTYRLPRAHPPTRRRKNVIRDS